MSETVYDLYTYSRGRWTLHQQFLGKSPTRAIAQAGAMLKGNQAEAVGVIREGPDRRGVNTETLAYSDTKVKNVPDLNDFPITPLSDQNHEATQGEYFKETSDEDEDMEALIAKADAGPVGPPGSAMALPLKLFTVAFIALCVGWALWTGIDYIGATQIMMDLVGPRNTASKTMGLGFVITLFILLPTTIKSRDFAAAFKSSSSAHDPRTQNHAPKPGTQNNDPERKSKDQQAPKKVGEDDDKSAKKKKKKKDAVEKGDGEQSEESESEDDEDKDDKKKDDAVPSKLSETRAKLVKFFERCMGYVLAADPDIKGGRMDAVTSFGCQLFFAGAAEILVQQERMAPGEMGKVLAPCAMALGQSKEQVAKFAEKYESYLLEPGYLDMFRAGREAMQTALKDEYEAAEKAAAAEAEAASGKPKRLRSPADADFDDDWESEEDIGIFLAHALDAWRSPKERKGKLTAVLFTDIVGSTSITQEHGDVASQVLVNVHNSIVRGALQAHGGWEVKHTGDGIMAGFSNPPASVDSGVEMQRGVAAYNKTKPDIELRLRVGISVGEPIAEDDDLFGATVQTAARLCDGAGTDGVMITNMLKEMCQGRALLFQDVEPKMFKGISDPVPVSLVEWRQKKKTAP